jgi:hypothetical protein
MSQRIVLTGILILAGIGFVWTLLYEPGHLLVPLVVFGIIALLIKFPPTRWSKGRTSPGRKYGPAPVRNHRVAAKSAAKRAKFRVIQGAKTDNDAQPPKYH